MVSWTEQHISSSAEPKQAHSRQCVTAVSPVEICFSYRCAVTQHQCTAALFKANCIPYCSVLLCKTGSHRQCVTAVTPVEICSSYRCAVTQHQCSATSFRAKCSPHCSVLLCKAGSQQALCQCSHTCGDLLFIQVCSDPAPMHCSSFQGKMQSPLFGAALQNRLTACLCHESCPVFALLVFLSTASGTSAQDPLLMSATIFWAVSRHARKYMVS